jgi:hypothetical protein
MANMTVARAIGLLALNVGLLGACGGESTRARAEGSAGDASSLAGSPSGGASSGIAGTPSAGVPSSGAPSTAEVMDTGPLDTTGLPTAFPPLVCDGPLGSLQLVLPCKVGMGGVSVVECYDVSGRTALTFVLILSQAAASLGQPMPVLGNASYAKLDVGGTRYTSAFHGSLTFSQVDFQGRGFVATLTDGHIVWTSAGQPDVDCQLPPMPLWAVGGNFI